MNQMLPKISEELRRSQPWISSTFLAQVFTYRVAIYLTETGQHEETTAYAIRLVPSYRTAPAKKLRRLVAQKVREIRCQQSLVLIFTPDGYMLRLRLGGE